MQPKGVGDTAFARVSVCCMTAFFICCVTFGMHPSMLQEGGCAACCDDASLQKVRHMSSAFSSAWTAGSCCMSPYALMHTTQTQFKLNRLFSLLTG